MTNNQIQREQNYTVKEIAEMLKLAEVSVYELIKTKKLRAFKIGGTSARHHWRIRESDLKAFIDEAYKE